MGTQTPETSDSIQKRRKDDFLFTKGISGKDKEEILEHINRVVDENKIPVTKKLFAIKPMKKGSGLLIAINILAIIIVAGTFFISSSLYKQREENLSIETLSYLSTEGKLIEELKRESENKLNEKDTEINRIQNEIAELDRKSADLRANMDATIKARETELRKNLEEELNIEREKLKTKGASAADIEAQIKALEEKRMEEYSQELADFKAESETALKAKESELQKERQLTKDILAKANEEKQAIEEKTKKRETELTARYEKEKIALQEKTSEAETKLESLSQLQYNEQLIMDQITGSYSTISRNIETSDFDSALNNIESLRNLILSDSVELLPNLAKRKDTELFILDTLKNEIESKTYKEDVDTTSLVEAADMLMSAREIASRGNTLYNKGEPTQAKEYYLRAFEELPALFEAYLRLNKIETEQDASFYLTQMNQGENLYSKGKKEEAISKYQTAAITLSGENSNLLSDALDKIDKSYKSILIEQISKKDKTLKDLNKNTSYEIETLKNETLLQKETIEIITSESDELKNDMIIAAMEIEKLTEINESFIELKTVFLNYKTKIDRLLSTGKREDFNRAKTMFNEFLDKKASDLFPGISNISSEIARKITRLGAADAVISGRETAFEDVLKFTNYLSMGDSVEDSYTISEITSLAGKERLYSKTIHEIQDLAAAGSAAAEISLLQSRFIGTVAYIDANRIIIEPLVSFSAEKDSKILIKRKIKGRETLIAEGKIDSITPDKIVASIKEKEEDKNPEVMDLVYLVLSFD